MKSPQKFVQDLDDQEHINELNQKKQYVQNELIESNLDLLKITRKALVKARTEGQMQKVSAEHLLARKLKPKQEQARDLYAKLANLKA